MVEGVYLPQVDVGGAQASQCGVQRREKVPTGAVGRAVGVGYTAGLGGDHQVLTGYQSVGQPTQQDLGVPVRVHVGGVHQRASGFPEGPEQGGGSLLGGLAPPGESAESDTGHAQAGAAKLPLLHDR